jgi:methionyl-tRNA formyltransferase
MIAKPLNIIFMGTPDFAVPALEKIINSNHHVVAVFSQPPRPSGRGQKLTKSPVHLCAEECSIPVFTPENFKKDNEAARAHFKSLNADIAVVTAYGLILPQVILDAPKYGCLNIHGSLLPRWRGAAPIQRAIEAGDTETGITIMQMERGLDTGPMISKKSCQITKDTTAQSLHDTLSQMGAKMIVETLNTLARDGVLKAETQDDGLSNYASMLSKEDGKIDWSRTAVELDCQIRGLNPWPSTWMITAENKVLKVLEARLTDQKTDKPAGTFLDKKGHIACGHGTVLQLIAVKPDNSKAMDFISAVNGGHILLN